MKKRRSLTRRDQKPKVQRWIPPTCVDNRNAETCLDRPAVAFFNRSGSQKGNVVIEDVRRVPRSRYPQVRVRFETEYRWVSGSRVWLNEALDSYGRFLPNPRRQTIEEK